MTTFVVIENVQLTSRALVAILFVSLAGCSKQDAAPSGPTKERPCLSAADVVNTVVAVQSTLDADPSVRGIAISPEANDGRCWKRSFRRGNYRVIAYGRADGTVYSTASPVNPPAGPACFTDAWRQAGQWVPYAGRLLARYASMEIDAHNPEVGWPAWVVCDGDHAEPQSVVTMLHELAHLTRNGQCLFDPFRNAERCIPLLSLPTSRIAILSPADLKTLPDDATRSIATFLQGIYFASAGKPMFTILDELNAYAVTADAQAARLEMLDAGDPGNVPPKEKRSDFVTPMFLWLVTRYFEVLERNHSAAYEMAFGPAGTRALVLAIFDDADAAIARWLRALAAAGDKPRPHEAWAIERYRALAKRLFGSWRQ